MASVWGTWLTVSWLHKNNVFFDYRHMVKAIKNIEGIFPSWDISVIKSNDDLTLYTLIPCNHIDISRTNKTFTFIFRINAGCSYSKKTQVEKYIVIFLHSIYSVLNKCFDLVLWKMSVSRWISKHGLSFKVHIPSFKIIFWPIWWDSVHSGMFKNV